MPTIGDSIDQAFTEIRVRRAGETLEPENMALGLALYNRLLDQWNANQRAVYSEQFNDSLTLTPALSPHTIGPSGSLNLTVRPNRLFAVQINLGSSVFTDVNVRDAAWYSEQSTPAISESVPTDVYYKPDWPLGRMYFFGVPSTAYAVRLWYETLLASVAQTDTFSMPPGYQAAIELTLAEELAESLGQSVSAKLERRAREARAIIFGNNDREPRIRTADAGLNFGQAMDIDWRSRRLR